MSKLSAYQVDEALIRRIIEGLSINCVSNTQVVVAQDSRVGSDDGSRILTAAADITIDITASGVDGLDTGVEAADTWYYLYMIYNPATEAVAGLLSISPTAPTMPAGYTYKRMIGAVRNDTSSNFIYFTQRGEDVQIDEREAPFYSGSLVAPIATAVFDISSRVPVIAGVARIFVSALYNSTTSAWQMIMGENASVMFKALVMSTINCYESNTFHVHCTSVQSLAIEISGTGTATTSVYVSGYKLSL